MYNLTFYISGPMTGYKDFNYPAFIAAEKELRKLGCINILNPAKIDHQDTVWENCIRRAIALMMGADVLILLPGWDKSKGAVLEVDIALKVGMSVATLETFKELVK